MHYNIKIRVSILVKYHQWKMMKFKLLLQGLHRIKFFHKMVETLFLHNQVSNMQNDIFIMYLICFSHFFFFFCEYLQIINPTALVKILQIGSGALLNYPAPPMIIVEHSIYHSINLYLIMKIKIIVMMELHKNIFPIICMKGMKWIIS